MVFSSVIFLFLFLPLVLFVYFIVPKILKNSVLLIFSLLFYAWGENVLVLLMIFSICLNYVFGILIERYRKIKISKFILIAGIISNLGLLGYYKYANFFVDNFNGILNVFEMKTITLKPIHLPIGISFFTFQAMSYIIDLYRQNIPAQKNPINIALYISLFPQLIAGPIVRYDTIAKQLNNRKHSIEKISYGIKRFIIGLAKKVLIANIMGKIADKVFLIPNADLSFEIAWVGVIAFSLQIYYDFSGYSDMAIGLGRIFGFDFFENFNYPYISKSVTEFWTRWHISLSHWLRDYLFLPIAYYCMRIIKSDRLLRIKNEYWAYGTGMIVTMLLGGLWHGASWNFIVWGLIHGVFSVFEKTALLKKLKKSWRPLSHIYALSVITISWVFFRSENFSQSFAFLKNMFGFGVKTKNIYNVSMYINSFTICIFILAIIFSVPIREYVYKKMQYLQGIIKKKGLKVSFYFSYTILNFSVYFLLLFLSSMSLVSGSYNPFIYFRF